MNMDKKFFLPLCLAAVLVCGCSEEKSNRTKMPTRVKTMIVSPSMVNQVQTYVGIVEEREATAVSFTSMGIVRRVLVSEGQAVARGQLIAEMDDTQARNLLDGAEAQMAHANDALQRYQMLHESGSLPEAQWVEVQSKVAQAKSQLEVAKKNLSDCQLTAPVGGIIGKKMVGAGETALPSQAVATILDISSVKVMVSVPETELASIHTNTPSSISVEAVGGQFSGGRIEKGVQADALTHTYEVRIQVANTNRQLLPGMVANVRFITDGSQAISSRSVPVTAVQRRADGSLFLWTVAQDSTVHRTTVQIGETSGNYVYVTAGITMGQRVVTEGYQKLSEGTKVLF
jgi:RND family efflux transporter MFP subunit